MGLVIFSHGPLLLPWFFFSQASKALTVLNSVGSASAAGAAGLMAGTLEVCRRS